MSSSSTQVTPVASPTLSSRNVRGSSSEAAAAEAAVAAPPLLTVTAPGASNDVPAAAAAEKERRETNRRRSSSIVHVEKIHESNVELLDQSAGFNANAEWVNMKGAWVIHVLLIVIGKILLDIIPGMGQDMSWSLVNLGYIAITYIMFHWVQGTPFESNAGAYDALTLWEQIDYGAQYTPAKKWLTSVPIALFLISTHYTRYNPTLFALNFVATVLSLVPKLPMLHRLRFKLFPNSNAYPSAPPTPTYSRPNSAAGWK